MNVVLMYGRMLVWRSLCSKVGSVSAVESTRSPLLVRNRCPSYTYMCYSSLCAPPVPCSRVVGRSSMSVQLTVCLDHNLNFGAHFIHGNMKTPFARLFTQLCSGCDNVDYENMVYNFCLEEGVSDQQGAFCLPVHPLAVSLLMLSFSLFM